MRLWIGGRSDDARREVAHAVMSSDAADAAGGVRDALVALNSLDIALYRLAQQIAQGQAACASATPLDRVMVLVPGHCMCLIAHVPGWPPFLLAVVPAPLGRAHTA